MERYVMWTLVDSNGRMAYANTPWNFTGPREIVKPSMVHFPYVMTPYSTGPEKLASAEVEDLYRNVRVPWHKWRTFWVAFHGDIEVVGLVARIDATFEQLVRANRVRNHPSWVAGRELKRYAEQRLSSTPRFDAMIQAAMDAVAQENYHEAPYPFDPCGAADDTGHSGAAQAEETVGE